MEILRKAGDYTVYIKQVASGIVADYRPTFPFYTHGTFLWQDGNFACDCNRCIFWEETMGVEEPDVDCDDDGGPACGDDKYRVRIVANDGTVLYQDDNF